MSYTVTLLETRGIQEYVFGSNNLGVNIGASELVEKVTEAWLFSVLPEPHNLEETGAEIVFNDRTIENDGLKSEVIYRGGGNALIIFADEPTAKSFIRALSKKTLISAPGLQIVAAHHPLEWNNGSLKEVFLKELRPAVARQKFEQPVSAELVGLGVSATCVFTGQPAAQRIKLNPKEAMPKLVSREVLCKSEAQESGKERLHRALPLARQKQFEFVYNFSDFGTHGESSYIAVIHSDGNSMGSRIAKHLESYGSGAQQNRDCIRALRAFSQSIARAAQKALQKTLEVLITSRDAEKFWRREGEQGLKVKQKGAFLPFRPVVFGGDDVTFVCDGRLGLALAEVYLQACMEQKLDDQKAFYTRAGVAVVKSHYPFARAYGLACELSDTPKKLDGYPDLSALDWHFAVSGLIGDLKNLRAAQYQVPAGNLIMRPVKVSDARDWRTWQTFETIVTEFQTKEAWSGRRNKLKALRENLRAGPDKVEQFLHYAGIQLPPIPALLTMQEMGWQGGYCAYFDAIEASDFYIPLTKGR